MNVHGSVALVTGGASGLGEATARRLVAGGAQVVLVDRDATRGAAVAESLGAAARFAQADVTQAAEVQAAVDAALAIGPLRIAVSCAGVGAVMRTLARDGSAHDLDAFKFVIGVNLVGTFNVLRLTAAAMARSAPLDDGERGVIVNTASIAAYDGQIGQIAYAASKGGIVGMTLPAARDLTPSGIRVVTIAPGTFDTPLMAALPEAARASLAAGVPFPRRLGRPEEYAALVEHIVGNVYLNGETIRLDGSLRMAPK